MRFNPQRCTVTLDHVAIVLEVEVALCLVSIPDAKRLPCTIDILALFRVEDVADVTADAIGARLEVPTTYFEVGWLA